MTGTGTSERYHHGDLHRALLDAALAIVREGGAGALTLRAVARRAGVSHMAPYHHFSGKAGLVAAVAEEGFRSLAAEMRDRMALESSARARFRACGIAYVSFAVRNPHHFRVMFGRELADKTEHPGLQRAAREAYSLFRTAMPRPPAGSGSAAPGAAAGETRGAAGRLAATAAGDGGLDSETALALAAWSLVHGLAMLVIDGQVGGRVPDAAEAERLALAATSGLRLPSG